MTPLPTTTLLTLRIGTAGWSIPVQFQAAFPQYGTHLERYASVFNAVEINTSFYRPHRLSTYQRWAAAVPESFRFAVKIPKAITHLRKLHDVAPLLDAFLAQAAGLGSKLGPLLVQLPPSLVFKGATVERFLGDLRARVTGTVACEPRHPSWFTPDVDALLAAFRIARVAADPSPVPQAAQPAGWPGLTYFRLHGSPEMYYTPYSDQAIEAVFKTLIPRAHDGSGCWCIFDNTASGAAIGNALTAGIMQG